MKMHTNKNHVLVNHSKARRANRSTKCDLFWCEQEQRHKWLTKFNVGEKYNVSSPSLCHDYLWASVSSAQTTCARDNQVSMLLACGFDSNLRPITKTVWFEWHTTQLSCEMQRRPYGKPEEGSHYKVEQPLLGQGRDMSVRDQMILYYCKFLFHQKCLLVQYCCKFGNDTGLCVWMVSLAQAMTVTSRAIIMI